MKIGRNVDVVLKGNKLTITIDLKKKGEPSNSGKTLVIATTQGNKPIADAGVVLGLNLYKPLGQ